MHVCVLVLGDVGRSPRMCYHALSMAEHGCHVDLVGYHSSQLPSQLLHHTAVRRVNIPTLPGCLQCLPAVLLYALKFIWLTLGTLFVLLFRLDSRCRMILLQNPPGVPTLAVCAWVCRWKRMKFVVDWHNYTFSVLRCQMEDKYLPKIVDKSNHFLVRMARKFEWHYGAMADLSFSVTRAMRENIELECGQRPIVLYDRPPTWKFPAVTIEDQHAFIYRMVTKHYFAPFVAPKGSMESEATSLSYRDLAGKAVWRDRRPAILLSSTSWTVDEDFRVLLDALVTYDDKVCLQGDDVNSSARLPDLIAVITGKGPQKNMYLSMIAELDLRHVEILTPWLEPEDYPRMLGCADVGLDLPMKVVDMFGCGVPVLARRFESIGELVNDGINGLTFDDSKQLALQIAQLLMGFPKYSQRLSTMANSLKNEPLGNWEDNWHSTVWPMLQRDLSDS